MGERSPLYQCLSGTSAEKLRQLGRPRSDGKSLSRIVQLVPSTKSDFLFIADSGPGEVNDKGLIVPKFGNKLEDHVAISMSLESLSELLLVTRIHYQAWLGVLYNKNISSLEIPKVSKPGSSTKKSKE